MNAEWASILDHIYDIAVDMRRGGNGPWFRGQRDATWPLLSTLHRNVNELISLSNGQLDLTHRRELLREEAKSLYHSFKSDAWAMLQAHERGEWSLVFHMQHHGIPTRLLDWSESFACALYFAQEERRPEADAAIYIIDPAELNESTVQVSGQIAIDDDMDAEARMQLHRWHPKYVAPDEDLPTIAVAPVLANRRMVAQRGAFTLSGDSFESLEKQYPGVIRKVVLPASTFSAAEQFLELVGTGPLGYFPDFEGLHRKFQQRRARHRALWSTTPDQGDGLTPS